MPEPPSESAIVREIVTELGRLGYEVLAVGQRKAKGSGTAVGYPDLSVRRVGWPRGLACLIEVKSEGGELRPEQQDLHERDWSFVARSADSALCSLRAFELSIGEDAAAERIERRIRIMRGGGR